MREMNEGMLLIESHCWIEWDEWERREEEIDYEDWEEKWLFWERERLSVLFMKWEWVDMDGCCWGDGLMMIFMIDVDELSLCLCFHPQWERERDWMRIDWRVIEMFFRNWEMSEWLKIVFKS